MRNPILLLLAALCLTVAAQDEIPPSESCTSIMVGRKASADGSVITGHTCDGGYRSSIYKRPPVKYERDTTEAIYGGRMFTDYADDRSPLKVRGEVPQVGSTFGYLDSAYPCLNERQLAFGESTISGRPELENPKGMFVIEELERLALERCTTARDAIRLIGEMVERYGYGDSGECLAIADTKEVWHFEIFGEGKDSIGAVWAAIRIPDDHVGVSANISRINHVDTTDTDHCMASANVRQVARRMGLWDGNEPFSFWRAYGNNYAFPDQEKSFDVRDFYILNALAPSLHLDFDAKELPLSVKPDKKVSVGDVLALYRETYQGSRFDPTKDLNVAVKRDSLTDTVTSFRANPWMLTEDKKMLSQLHGDKVAPHRPVAVAFCSYATVIQLRDWLPDDIGGVVWLSLDNPAQSPRIPIYCGVDRLPETLATNGNSHYLDNAAIWHFRLPNKLGALKWGQTRDETQEAIAHFEQKGIEEMPMVEARYKKIAADKGVEQARKYLSDYTADFLGAAMLRWDEMGRQRMFKGRYGF